MEQGSAEQIINNPTHAYTKASYGCSSPTPAASVINQNLLSLMTRHRFQR